MKKPFTHIRGGKKATLAIIAQEKRCEETCENLSEQVRAVLGLYEKLLNTIQHLRAKLMDRRHEGIESLRMQCVDLLKTLDTGLDLKGELAENLHTLYGHCLRRLLTHDGYTEIEALDSVEMVVSRIRHMYIEVAKKDSAKEEASDGKKSKEENLTE